MSNAADAPPEQGGESGAAGGVPAAADAAASPEETTPAEAPGSPASPGRAPRVTDKLKSKLTELQLELQRMHEDDLHTKAKDVGRRASEQLPASVVTLVFDLDTIAHDERYLRPEGPAEFFVGKLLAADIPIAFLVSGMDLELLHHINPRFLKQLIAHPLAVLVSSTWARSRPSLYPELFHLNVVSDKVTRTEVGVTKSRALFLSSSDLVQSLIAFIAAADYPVAVLDHLDTALHPLHPYQTPPGVPDTCVVRALGVHTASVRAVVMNAQGSCQEEFEAAIRGGADAIEQLEKRLLCVARQAGAVTPHQQPATPPPAGQREGSRSPTKVPAAGGDANRAVYGAVRIDLLQALAKSDVVDTHAFDDISVAIAKSLLDLSRDALTFKALDEDTVKTISLASDLSIYLPTPPPIKPDGLLSRVKALSHRVLHVPEYHQRLLLAASSSSLTQVNREMCLACLDLIPDVIPDDGAESLDIILNKRKDDPTCRQSDILHSILSQYTTNAPSVLQILH